MKLFPVLLLAAFFGWLMAGCSLGDVEPPTDRIACLGTSITDGYQIPIEQAYPPVLKTLIGPPHNVLNYGVSGTTLLRKGDFPYAQSDKYGFALQWKPTIVVLEFGTNDSKKQNWVYKSDFKSDYAALISSLRQVSGQPKIYLCIPPPAFSENYGIQPDVIRQEIAPLIREVATENNVQLIDLYTPLLTKPELFPDGIHPNAEGTALIANIVYKAIVQQ